MRLPLRLLRVFWLIGGIGLMVTPNANAQGDAAARLCQSLLAVDIKDTSQTYSDEEHFSQFQNLIKSANLSSYQDFEQAGDSLGINIPIASDLLGLTNDSHDNSGVFQKQVSEFLTTSYGQRMDRGRNMSAFSRINTQLLDVERNCQDKYFASLRDRVQLSIEIDPNSYTSFTLIITANIKQSLNRPLVIDQIEPAELVQCNEQGHTVQLGIDRPSDQAALSCSKEEKTDVTLRIVTNAGISPPIHIPAKPTRRAAPPIAIASTTTLTPYRYPTWSPKLSPEPPPFTNQSCQCATYKKYDEYRGLFSVREAYVEVANHCKGNMDVFAMRDESEVPPSPNERTPGEGRYFCYWTIKSGEIWRFDFESAKHPIFFRTTFCPAE